MLARRNTDPRVDREQLTREHKWCIVDQYEAQGLWVPCLENRNEELGNVKVHVPDPKSSHVEEETAFVVRGLQQDANDLNIVQDVRLHGLGRLQIWVMQRNLDDIDGAMLSISGADVTLAGPILRKESFLIGRGVLLERNVLPNTKNSLLYVLLVTPVDGGDQHGHCPVDVPLPSS